MKGSPVRVRASASRKVLQAQAFVLPNCADTSWGTEGARGGSQLGRLLEMFAYGRVCLVDQSLGVEAKPPGDSLVRGSRDECASGSKRCRGDDAGVVSHVQQRL